MVHRGEIIERIVRKSGYSLSKLAAGLAISRNTLYNRFQDPDVNWGFIKQLGKIIHHDFTIEFPELKDDPEVLEGSTMAKLESKYINLLERHNQLMSMMLLLASQTDSPQIRQKVTELLEKETAAKK